MGKKEYIVIGLGQFGMSIAQTLMQNDCEVLVLDINEKRTRAIADSVTCAVTGNVMDAELLAGSDTPKIHAKNNNPFARCRQRGCKIAR